ncbi:MAG: DUF6044 family protein [bacterium]|nr:DUF6044 family protein [bacterium]
MEKQKRLRFWKSKFWFLAGSLAVLCTVLPYFLLGEDSIFAVTDQLDGEMIAYILQARHLFQKGGFAEFMNGASKTALTVPAPFAVLLFLSGHYCGALITMAVTGKLCGFVGMYLLVREITERREIAAAAGFLYSCIPFLPVYGLAEFGLPLLIWSAWQLKKGRHLIFVYCYTAVYALSSSLVLVGFAVLGVGLLWILWALIRVRREKADRAGVWRVSMAWVLMLILYIVENIGLFAQLFGSDPDSVTHKSAYVHSSAGPFWNVFLENLLKGDQHSQGYQLLLQVSTAAAFVVGVFFLKGRKKDASGPVERKIRCFLRVIACCFAWNLFFASTAAVWRTSIGVEFRSRLSFLGTFQLNRLLWLAPCLWYVAAACGMAVFWEMCLVKKRYCIILLFTWALWMTTALWMLWAGDFKLNLQKLRNPDYGMLSYRDYYALGVMEQVRDYLDQYTGQDVSEYRVVSLGIDPVAALYHGFYCLDGYSNNYSLEYKKSFRRIIAPELDKSDYLKQYFDDWGNRCYLFSSEVPGYFTIEKYTSYFLNYEIDKEALYEMGGRYILSAVYIANAKEQGLILLNETPIEAAGSYYLIYIYEVEH